jgi:hypothetical protein
VSRRRVAAVLVGGLVLAACPKDEEPRDRAIELLKAEQERLRKEGQAPRRPADPDPLAEIAAGEARPENLGIPSGVNGDLGPVTLSLAEVQIAQTVGQRVKLSTTDQFVRVTLEVTTREAVTLDLAGARLVQGERAFALARDAQRAAGGSPLTAKIQPGGSERLVLFFEAPREALGPGLKLVLSTASSRVELALQ